MNQNKKNMMELEEVRRISSPLNVNREPLTVKRCLVLIHGIGSIEKSH